MENFRKVFTPSVRRWLYRVLIALLPILTAAGIITEDMAPMVAGLIAAALAIGVADINVPEAPDYEESANDDNRLLPDKFAKMLKESREKDNPFNEVIGK